MKLKKIRSLLCVLLCVSLLMPSSQVAALLTEPPADISVDWVSPSSFVGLVCNPMQATIQTDNKDFYVSFPVEGGVRVNTDASGFHTPASCGQITYEALQSGWRLTGENGSVAVLTYTSSNWTLSVLDSNNKCTYTLCSDNIMLGYSENKVSKVALSGSISAGEAIYGFGEQHQMFNSVGRLIYLWNDDSWSSNAYKNINYFNSTKGYSVFFNSTYYGEADMGYSDSDTYRIEFRGPTFDIYLYAGTPLENLERYTALTGTQCLSPKWAFRYWAGAASLYWDEGNDPISKLQTVMSGYRSLGVDNLSVVFGENTLYRLPETYDVVKYSGTKILGWNMPHASHHDIACAVTELSRDIADYDLPCFRSASNPNSWFSTANLPVDHSHPNISKWLEARWGSYIEQGLKGLMLDYGELMQTDMLSYTGQSGADMHNLYSYYYVKAYDELFSNHYPDGDYMLFCRAGTAGVQKYAAAFAGDQEGTFAGLKLAINAGLNISASGFSTWGSDIGGLSTTTDTEVYARWLQFGTFSPIMRIHGSREGNPWGFGETGESVFKTHYWLRENLLDHIYSKSIIANKTGSPMMKPMVMAYPEDVRLREVNDQYMFCDDLMVCTVSDAGVTSRDVIFPEGKWVSLWDGSVYEGSTVQNVEAPLEHLPVFIREGAVIPVTVSSDTLALCDSMQYSDSVSALLVTQGENEVTHWTDTENCVNYTLKSNTGLHIESSSSKTRAVIAYVDGVTGVTVDGVALEKLDSLPKSGQTGYYVDGNRTVIRVTDANWKEIHIIAPNIQASGEECSWDFSESNAVEATAGLETYVANVRVENAEEWQTETNTACATDTTALVSKNTSYSKERGMLITEKSYTDFELTVTAQGANGTNNHGWPRIMIGVKDPTKSYMNDSDGGIAIRFHSDLIGKIVWEGKMLTDACITNSWVTDTMAEGFVNTAAGHYYASSNITEHKIKVSGNTLTVTIKYVGNSDKSVYTATGCVTLPDTYSGGRIGICYSTSSDAGRIYNMSLKSNDEIYAPSEVNDTAHTVVAGKYLSVEELGLPKNVIAVFSDGTSCVAEAVWNTDELFEDGEVRLNISDALTLSGTVSVFYNLNGQKEVMSSPLECECEITAIGEDVWEFENSNVVNATEGLTTWVYGEKGNTKVNNTDIWTQESHRDGYTENDGYIICKTVNQRYYGMLLTEKSFTDFKLSATVRGAYIDGNGPTKIAIGVVDPTAKRMSGDETGYFIYYDSEEGLIRMDTCHGRYNITDSAHDGYTYDSAANLLLDYIIEVKNGLLTVTVQSADDGDIYCSDSIELPSGYAGGNVGLQFNGSTDEQWAYGNIMRLCAAGEYTAQKGDVNNDGRVDIRDIVQLKKYISGMDAIINTVASDLVENEANEAAVNANDITALRRLLISG